MEYPGGCAQNHAVSLAAGDRQRPPHGPDSRREETHASVQISRRLPVFINTRPGHGPIGGAMPARDPAAALRAAIAFGTPFDLRTDMQESEPHSAKRQGILPEVVVGIYVLVLGGLWALDYFRPDITANLLQLIRGRNDLEFHDHLRYRALLYYAASVCFVVLAPVVLHRGIHSRGVAPSQDPHWSNYLIVMIGIPIGWYMYPKIAVCKNCWMANDAFYFWITTFFFVALQLSIYVLWVKFLKLLRRK